MVNKIYCGDCLFVMRHDILERGIKVDLIYLDPPFFTGKVQKGTWQPGAMEISFEDSKKFWGTKGIVGAPTWLKELGVKLPAFASYLNYMRKRLELCKLVLKDTGSIYLHCDSKASHYLKMIMDRIFGENNFRNEIIWQRSLGHHLATGMDVMTDSIFFYSKNKDFVYNQQYQKLSKEELEKKFPTIEEETGRRFQHRQLEQAQNIGSRGETRIIQGKEIKTEQGWRWSQETIDKRLKENPYLIYWTSNGRPRYKIYADEYKGRKIGNLWTDITHLSSASKERVGFPTQKPESLLERIINTSSNPSGLVLDPFCGCGTAIIVAHKLKRNWIGIDINVNASEVMKNRFEEYYNLTPEVHLREVEAVKKLNPKQFEEWVNEFYQAKKPMPDRGVDGITDKGIPIQTKTNIVKYNIVSQFLNDMRYHPDVPKPVKHGIIVSQIGFDESALARVFQIKQKDKIDIKLVTPEDLF